MFAGAQIDHYRHDPLAVLGQADALRVPQGDIALFMHQLRPLRPGRSVTVIHDTIPLRYGGGTATRTLKRAFLVAVARLSTRILTPSEFSKSQIVEQLGVSPERIGVMRYPVHRERAERIAALRASVSQEQALLCVGRFAEHKNVRRLCIAFAKSQFANEGGRLQLVGGWEGEVPALERWIAATGLKGISVFGVVPQDTLERLMASSRALIAPSLEEGYGLPAFEAAAAGLPVAASPTGAMTELPSEAVITLDPTDLDSITRAIDDVVVRVPRRPRLLESDAREAGTLFRDIVLDSLSACFRRELAHRGITEGSSESSPRSRDG
jgi:glycosyltransferase involved in cell wall biosynthesis